MESETRILDLNNPRKWIDEDGTIHWEFEVQGEAGVLLVVGGMTLGASLAIAELLKMATQTPKLVTASEFPHLGEDHVELSLSPAVNPAEFKLTLESNLEWLKSADLAIGKWRDLKTLGTVSTKGTRTRQALAVPADIIREGVQLVLGKAKVLGILTQMYQLPIPKEWAGNDLTVRWLRDRPITGAWWEGLPGGATDIGVGANGAVWIIGTDDRPPDGFGIYRWNGRTWDALDGAAVRIAVDPAGTPWVVNRGGAIYRRGNDGWEQMPGGATDIGIGADGAVWIIGTDDRPPDGFGIYRWNGSTWDALDGAAVRIAVDPAGTPWVVNRGGAIYRRGSDGWDQMPGGATDIGIGADGAPWVIGTDEKPPDGYGIHWWHDDGWEAVDGAGLQISVAPGGAPWVVNAGGGIYRRNG